MHSTEPLLAVEVDISPEAVSRTSVERFKTNNSWALLFVLNKSSADCSDLDETRPVCDAKFYTLFACLSI